MPFWGGCRSQQFTCPSGPAPRSIITADYEMPSRSVQIGSLRRRVRTGQVDENIGKIVTPSADRKRTATEILEVRRTASAPDSCASAILRTSVLMGQSEQQRSSRIQEAEAAAAAATAAAAAAGPKDAKSARQVKAAAKRAARALAQAGKSKSSPLFRLRLTKCVHCDQLRKYCTEVGQ